jgi:hypothetical protein
MFAFFALTLCLFQDAPPPLPPLPDAPATAGPVLDIDGEPVAPGKLPKSTQPQASAAWQKMIAAGSTTGEARTPITGFDLALDLRLKIEENRTNDFPKARYAYLAPNFLLFDTGKGRKQLRGPDGDWLVDSKAGEGRALVKLDVGRENAQDRRQIEDGLDVARLFVGVVDARNVKVIRFEPRGVPEALLPPGLVEHAKKANPPRIVDPAKLAWFELQTPDVRPGAQNQAGARILLGISPETGLPAIAIADDARAPQRVNPTTSCVVLSDWRPLDGWMLPRQISVYLPRLVEQVGAGGATSRAADGWRKEPGMDLVVTSGSLKNTLKPDDFKRPDPATIHAPPEEEDR